MKTCLKLMAAAFSLLSVGVAQAGFITVGGTPAGPDGQVTSFGSACTVNFNSNGPAANACNVTYGNTTASNFPSGSNAFHTAPPGDTTTYLSVGPNDGNNVTATLPNPVNYFGFFTGVMNSSDVVRFFLNNVLVDSFTGDEINAVAFPLQINRPIDAPLPSAYINFFPTFGNLPLGTPQQTFYDSILFSTAQNSLETDNHAFAVQAFRTPEPESVALLGLGALAWFASRRRKTAA